MLMTKMLLKNQNSSRSLETNEKKKIKNSSDIKSNRHSLHNHWDFKVVVLIIQNVKE